MKFKKIKFHSIRTKLIISLVAICVIPLIITGFGSYNQSRAILSKKLTLTSTQTLSEINNGLLDYFKGFSDKVVLTANNPSFMNSDTDNNTSMILDVLKSVKESDKDILCMYYGTASDEFATYPLEVMPEGYDATTRPWYK